MSKLRFQARRSDVGRCSVSYNLRYPGQIYDGQAGLHQNYFRDFDPAVERYVESDPIGLKGGINTYAYVGDDPIWSTDPLGLWVKRCSRTLGKTHLPVKPDSPLYNNYLTHDYLSVSGQTIGFFPKHGLPADSGTIQYGGESPDGAGCSTVCGDDAFDKYVIAAVAKIGAPNYCLLAMDNPSNLYTAVGLRNCQTWADDVLAEAKKEYLAHEHCSTCFR